MTAYGGQEKVRFVSKQLYILTQALNAGFPTKRSVGPRTETVTEIDLVAV